MSLTDWIRDIRYGCRSLGRTPGFAAAIVFVIAIGVGLNTAVFSLVNQALLSAMPR